MPLRRAMRAAGVAALFAWASSAPADAATPAPRWHCAEWTVMTTRASLSCRVRDAAQGDAAVAAVRAEFERIEALLSPWRETSELSRINRAAFAAPVSTTPEVFSLFTRSADFNRLSHGAFDAAFAAAGQLYDYRQGIAPDAAQLADVKAAVGWHNVALDAATRSVRYAHPRTRVDFGGIAKGYAIDRAVALLRVMGLADCHVALGGDAFALGRHGDRPWIVGIRHPRANAAQATVRLPLENLAISTSGDYERFFIDANGARIHHILAPDTGRPATGLVSATVIAPDSTTADALSTAVFVLGREKGLALVATLPDVSAVVIDADGRVHYSADLAPGADAPGVQGTGAP